MMDRLKAVGIWLVLIAVFVGFAAGAYAAGEVFLANISELSPEVAAALVGGFATILIGLFTTIWNQRSLKRREIREAQRPNKNTAYKKFVEDVVIDTLKKSKTGELKKMDDKQLQELFFNTIGDLLVWASPDFIRSYQQFRAAGQREDQRILIHLDEMLQAIRKDLGHSDWILSKGDLIKLFLTDPESVDKLVD